LCGICGVSQESLDHPHLEGVIEIEFQVEGVNETFQGTEGSEGTKWVGGRVSNGVSGVEGRVVVVKVCVRGFVVQEVTIQVQ
jgi:hypothetical protein